MNRRLALVTASALVLVLAALSTGAAAPALDAEPTSSPVPLRLDCVVYRIESPALLAQVEAVAEDAAAMLEIIRGPESGAKRLARMQGVTASSGEISYSNSTQVPMVTVNQGQFSTQKSFNGYQKADTSLSFVCVEQGGQVDTRYSIQIESFQGDKKELESTPPPRDRIAFTGRLTSALGASEGFVIDGGGEAGSALVVAITVSAG